MKKKRGKRTELKLDDMTHEAIIVILVAHTLIDQLDYADQDYWHIKNLKNRFKALNQRYYRADYINKIKFVHAHELSDIAWQMTREAGSPVFSAIAVVATILRKYETSIVKCIGPVDDQINGIVKYYYGRPEMNEVQMDSWKLMQSFIKSINKTLYDWNQDKEGFIGERTLINRIILERDNNARKD